MRKILQYFVFICLLPIISIGKTKQDSINGVFQNEVIGLKKGTHIIDSLRSELQKVNSKHEYQLKINEQTLNSISNQISATSFNLTVFGIIFGIAALLLGIYVTYIERKIVSIREETQGLLKSTIETKNEVESINQLIQKDINGLFLKIKREETVYILNRLVKIPKDIGNFMNELLSRELEREDFNFLKKAYEMLPNEDEQGIKISLNAKEQYQLLFFQHFLDLAIKDDLIGSDLVSFYPQAISCAFENDMIKSTEDFSKAIIDKGFQNSEEEINGFIIGLSQSKFSSMNQLYEIIFNSLRNREDRFKFFNLISSNKTSRIGKLKFGSLLISNYTDENNTESEKIVFERIKEIDTELFKEEEKKRKQALESIKRQQEQK